MSDWAVLVRFCAKFRVCPDTGCWLWTKAQSGNGYGAFWFEGKDCGAHRVAYGLFVGPIPAGLHLDHLCRTPLCVNPDHLEPVTIRENIRRGPGSVPFCAIGHPFSGPNLYIHPTTGQRVCRACQARWQADYRARGGA